MISNFDHVTLAVTNLEEAIRFFGLLGFELARSVVISGEAMDEYMGASGLEADHVTLVIPEAHPRQEVQLLRYHRPPVAVDEGSGNLLRTGFNHVCFRVADLAASYARLIEHGAGPVWDPRDSPEPGMRMAYVTDPDGNLIELVSPVAPSQLAAPAAGEDA